MDTMFDVPIPLDVIVEFCSHAIRQENDQEVHIKLLETILKPPVQSHIVTAVHNLKIIVKIIIIDTDTFRSQMRQKCCESVVGRFIVDRDIVFRSSDP